MNCYESVSPYLEKMGYIFLQFCEFHKPPASKLNILICYYSEVEVQTSRELLMTPVVVARNKQEKVLIEPSVNSVR